jgi:nitroreductase
MNVNEKLAWRYATKKFDPAQKIADATWAVLEQALILTPTSYGMQPLKFLVLTDPALRAQLVPVSWGQTQPLECSHYVVFAYRKGLSVEDIDLFVRRIAEVRGVPVESLEGYRGFILGSHKAATENGTLDDWCARQVYIAIGQAMTAAALLGIDTCPMEGILPSKYDELLGLDAQGYASVCTVAFGYRAADDKHSGLSKVRFPKSQVIKYV